MWEYGYGLRLEEALLCGDCYIVLMRETDGVARGVRQHTSADVAPELYELPRERGYR